ncbi:hypothetical protein J5N97_027270 [Dioscorea zingiberensis]|uniref:PGG domain-containing protein n=1 Tax=Dioscorea zingiberensis TaxID=325984 RepID=A0A9D5C4X2_9LILI|nr:hypothetical protein J5N97_027270 [Dioscorea zingiberensis]
MGPHRRHMRAELYRAASLGDVNAFSTLLSLTPTDASVVHDQRNIDVRPAIHAAPKTETESIFSVTAGGNTVLHIASEHSQLKFAMEVFNLEPSLVTSVNSMLDTPLHCCAKAGHYQTASFLIDSSREGVCSYAFQDILRARNINGDTVLHNAVQGNHILVVEKLIAVDDGLASIVNNAGFSPLYYAVMQNSPSIVRALLKSSSCSDAGPSGRTALHAAAFRYKEITRMLLEWKPKLGRVADDSNSIPLHYVAAGGDSEMARILSEHDAFTVYIPDKDGSYSMHIAAHMGHVGVISSLLELCPDSIELVDDIYRRTFVHVAVLNHRQRVIKHVLQTRGLEKLLNQQDCEGNTPLHLAVKNGSKEITYELLKDWRVQSSIMNNEGLTPLDLSITSMEMNIAYFFNAQTVVMKCLANCGAIFSPQRSDYAIQARDKAYDPEKEAKKRTSLSRNLAIASVLIATVTFAAGFTMPGGYRSDDGTSILTRKYPFKVFLISDTCAMIFSLIATVQIICAGTPLVDNSLRQYHILCSISMLWISFVCMSVAFGMASFAVVVPKAWGLGVLVCILTFIAPLVATVITKEPLIHTRCAIILRNGRMRSNMDPHIRRQLQGAGRVSFWRLTYDICILLLVYLVVFLLALL